MMLASVMTYNVLATFMLIGGTVQDDMSIFCNQDLKTLLREPNAIWMPNYQSQAIVLGNLPDEVLDHFSSQRVSRMHALMGVLSH